MAAGAAAETAGVSRKPSFKGRLKLREFIYRENTDCPGGIADNGLRRSSRLSTAPVTGTSPSPLSALGLLAAGRASSTPSKRKAAAEVAAADSGTISSAFSSPHFPSKRHRSGHSSGGGGSSSSRGGSGYAPPSMYAHLSHLPDAMAPNLLVLFVGLNPGIETARQQHAYAHPTNKFWRLLASSGVTPRLCAASEDRSMPRLYSLGLTNIVSRPSRNGAELSKAEMDAGVSVLEAKARRWRPEVVCIVGKSIWESVWRVRHARPIRKEEFKYGWQDETENMGVVGEEDEQLDEREQGVEYRDDWRGARVFVATSTSGLAATLAPAEKEAIWKDLGVWVQARRLERAAAATGA